MDFVTVFTALNPADAQLARSRSEAAGFHPFVADELAALSMDGYALATAGIHVQVPEDEAADAKEFLNAPPNDRRSRGNEAQFQNDSCKC